MKIKGRFTKSLSVLVFFMIGIMVFAKGNTGQILQIVVFSIWATYLGVVYFSTSFIKFKNTLKAKFEEQKVYSNIPVNNVQDEHLSNVINTLLSENVSDKLSAVFPECKWSFDENSNSFINSGETIILTENADGYGYANISINKNKLDLIMVKKTNINDLKNQQINQIQSVDQSENIDIYSWFANIGKQKFKEIADNTIKRDCHEFRIKENGCVFINKESETIQTTIFSSLPPMQQWGSIIPLIEDIGYVGFIENNELVIGL